MKKEVTVQAKTVEEAVRSGAEQLGTDESGVVYEVIEEPKKGFLGMGSIPATVKVIYVFKPLEAARSFAQTLIKDLCLDADVIIHDDGSGEALMEITGTDAGVLIGHHGDTLDAFQYLVNLAANKKETDERKYTRISVDIENYREKREQTLRALADRMANKVKKTGRSVTLEPMNAYERRIIHAQVQGIAGVSTNSVGAEGNRRRQKKRRQNSPLPRIPKEETAEAVAKEAAEAAESPPPGVRPLRVTRKDRSTSVRLTSPVPSPEKSKRQKISTLILQS